MSLLGVRQLARLTTLEELLLGSDKVTDACVETLAGLKSLRKLSLNGTRVTDAGLRELAEY